MGWIYLKLALLLFLNRYIYMKWHANVIKAIFYI